MSRRNTAHPGHWWPPCTVCHDLRAQRMLVGVLHGVRALSRAPSPTGGNPSNDRQAILRLRRLGHLRQNGTLDDLGDSAVLLLGDLDNMPCGVTSSTVSPAGETRRTASTTPRGRENEFLWATRVASVLGRQRRQRQVVGRPDDWPGPGPGRSTLRRRASRPATRPRVGVTEKPPERAELAPAQVSRAPRRAARCVPSSAVSASTPPADRSTRRPAHPRTLCTCPRGSASWPPQMHLPRRMRGPRRLTARPATLRPLSAAGVALTRAAETCCGTSQAAPAA
jgi:hypothetical protein